MIFTFNGSGYVTSNESEIDKKQCEKNCILFNNYSIGRLDQRMKQGLQDCIWILNHAECLFSQNKEDHEDETKIDHGIERRDKKDLKQNGNV